MGFSKEKVNLQKRHKREYYDTTRENKQICRRRKFTYPCFIACNGKASEISNHSSNPIVTIERFDKGLPSYAQETDTAKIFLFIDKYTPFFRSIVDTYSVWEMLHRSKRD